MQPNATHDPKKITWVADGIGHRTLADGRTKAYCIDYMDAHKKRVRVFRDPETNQPLRRERDAREALAKVIVRQSEGLELVRSTIKLTDLADAWLGRQIDVTEGMLEQWRLNLRLHILPKLGHLEVAKINENHIRDLMLAKRREGKAESTVRNIVQPLRMILDEAVIQRILATNPWIRVPKKERPSQHGGEAKRILTLDEVEALLAGARSKNLRLLALTSIFIYSGIRKSEALGLTWNDIDFDQGLLRIRLQLDRNTNERVPLKTKASQRDIPIARELRAALLEWRLQSLHSQPEDFVFVTATGTPLSQRNALRMVTTLAEDVGINCVPENPDRPNVDIHSLRHVFASAMILASKGDGERVRRLTGHKDVETLTKVYTHEFEAVRGGRSIADEAALIDTAFGG